ncbi:hypothetical protein ID866_3450 [Astraeus odoratus]|nr:hypothetical protein ID866_3450 [Astraeus odoratus]
MDQPTFNLNPPHFDIDMPPTDYGQFVVNVLARMTRESGTVDQSILRRAIGLASSFLLADASTNAEGGIATWQTGFNRLIDVVVVLHHRDELELESFNEASKACSECWSVAGTWRGMEECRQGVKEVAGKLKKLLDEPNRRTYKGHKVVAYFLIFIRSMSRPARPTRPVPAVPDNDKRIPEPDLRTLLTPIRAHYLKKSLIQLQFHRELDDITNAPADNASTLAYLGPPFAPPPKGAQRLDLPFLRYIFRHFVLTFPFMAAAPKDFYSDKLQPFVASIFARNLSPTVLIEDADDEETSEATRLKILQKVERNLAVFFSAGTKLLEPEQVVRLSQLDLDRLERIIKKRRVKKDVFDVNIVCIRAVTDKGRLIQFQEFIIRTRLSQDREICVSRRYGDFKTLADELRKAHPEEIVPSPPAKDRTAVDMTAPALAQLSSPTHSPTQAAFDKTSQDSLPQSSPIPGTFHAHAQQYGNSKHPASRLSREKNRLTLRAYLHSLLATPAFASSPLPQNYRALIEWARISLASTLFQTYVASDNSSETFAGLKRIHGLMPYFLLKAALKISNPVGMIRTVLDIFLAQPFGGRSLLQRMFTSSLSEEAKSLTAYIQHVSEEIADPVLCEKVRVFVYASRERQDFYRVSAAANNVHLLRVIMHGKEEPFLDRAQLTRVERAGRKWEAWEQKKKQRDEDSDDEGPPDEEAWLFEDLRLLVRLYSRLRDREQLIALIFEGVTAELLKDIITIFYAPLAQVYRAASIADSVSDLQDFINDLIRTVEQTEALSQLDPTMTVQAFIDLVSRHEQAFYTFVHKVHSKGAGLFDSLMHWIERFLTVTREGFGAGSGNGGPNEISLETLLPAGDKQRAELFEEVDKVVRYHYALKVAHEERLRRRFERSQGGNSNEGDMDAADKEAQILVHNVVKEIDLGELAVGEAGELFAQDTDEEDDYETEEDETDSEKDTSSEFETDSEEEEEPSQELFHPNRSLASLNPRPRDTIGKARAFSSTPGKDTHPPLPPKSNTMAAQPITAQPQVRQRAFSLRSVRSMTFLKDKGKDKEWDLPPPPVPPLPSRFEKELPPRPSNSSSPIPSRAPKVMPMHKTRSPSEQLSVDGSASLSSARQPLPSHTSGQPPPEPASKKKGKRKKGSDVLEPPELEYIPLLLPVFVEMMRPLLRPTPLS